MKKSVVLKIEKREKGSKHAAQLREQGKIPAVVYGHKQEPVAVSVDLKSLVDGLHAGSRVFEIELEGAKDTVLVKDLEYDFLNKDVIHADLLRVNMNEKAHVSVPVKIKGEAKGVALGGILDVHLDQLDLNCPVVSIPEAIVIKVAGLGIGDAILAGSIALPAGAELLTDPSTVVVNCHMHVVKEEVEGEAGTEPEVITEKKAAE